MATKDSTNFTSRTIEPRLYKAQETSRRSQLHNAHKDVNVERVAVNKCEYSNPTYVDISYFRNPKHFSLFYFIFMQVINSSLALITSYLFFVHLFG